ncbi:hypothetical protein [Streptomyces sp. NPDC047000]|uniref:hypothetical protein n=1 Tax=Streptomyces sp. NPDC047000 TaxID=3155474 RepID=UPI0033C0A240
MSVSTHRTASAPRSVADGESPLLDVTQVPWHELSDSSGSAAAIPFLIAAIASGDPGVARHALERLADRVCEFGFVVGQATAATVPFLWLLARQPQVTCRPQILRLLENIAGARQWQTTAAAYPKLLRHHDHHVRWERTARQAVRAGRDALPGLLADRDPDIARAAADLAAALGR